MNSEYSRMTRRTALAVLGTSAAGLLPHSGPGVLAAPVVGAPRLYHEKFRPQFHFTARHGWINDPNGLVYVNGIYHLFFQYLPNSLNGNSGNKYWGHAISRDLIHWRQLQVAISPDKFGGIWSGSAAVDTHNTTGFQRGNNPPVVAMYTAAGGSSKISQGEPFAQCLAYSNDGGMTFVKYAHNPVLGQIVSGNRDPKIFWHAPSHRWIVPLFLNADRGFAILTSPDLISWHKTQELHFPQSQECPNLFPLADPVSPQKQHWIFTAANGQYLIGDFNGTAFTPRSGPFAMDTGNSFYASQIFNDIPKKDGRTIQITWMRGGSYPGMPFNQQLGFPCTLALQKSAGGLRIARWPVREIHHLWRAEHRLHNASVAHASHLLQTVASDILDIEMEIAVGNSREIALTAGGVSIQWSAGTGAIRCLGASGTAVPENGRLALRLLLDRTSLELFVGGGLCSMSSCYLPKVGRGGSGLTANGRGARVTALAIRELKSAWNDIPPA